MSPTPEQALQEIRRRYENVAEYGPWQEQPEDAPRDATLRLFGIVQAALAARGSGQWSREVPETEGWYWLAIEGRVFLRQVVSRWQDGQKRLAVFGDDPDLDMEGWIDDYAGWEFMPADVPPPPAEPGKAGA